MHVISLIASSAPLLSSIPLFIYLAERGWILVTRIAMINKLEHVDAQNICRRILGSGSKADRPLQT